LKGHGFSRAAKPRHRRGFSRQGTQSKKDGPYRQANGGTSQEGTIHKLANFPNNVK